MPTLTLPPSLRAAGTYDTPEFIVPAGSTSAVTVTIPIPNIDQVRTGPRLDFGLWYQRGDGVWKMYMSAGWFGGALTVNRQGSTTPGPSIKCGLASLAGRPIRGHVELFADMTCGLTVEII